MNISAIQAKNLADIETDLLAIGVFEGQKRLSPEVQKLDKSLMGYLKTMMADERFDGKFKETLMVQTGNAIKSKRVLLVGLGKAAELNSNTWREIAAVSLHRAKDVKAKKIALVLPDIITAHRAKLTLRQISQFLTEGFLLGNYHYATYHGEKTREETAKSAVDEVLLVDLGAKPLGEIKAGMISGQRESNAVILARDLVNPPSSDMTPQHLVDAAMDIKNKGKRLAIEVFDVEEMKKRGMGGILTVAKGSDEPPYFIHLSYRPARKPKRKIYLVGKGITFDSGGLSLKPSKYMESMKIDMAGAAAVLGVFSVISQLNLAVEVHGLIPTTENMPSGKAAKPGDIAKALNGKTIEILNTDAEGRVVLADALSFASQAKADVIVDLATLTGSCVEALGEEVAGLFCTQPRLSEGLKEAAKEAGENLWELPLVAEYKSQIKSKLADVKNTGGGHGAGVITAALFLKEFVDAPSWAHLDIAGPAWAERETYAHVPLGGTGFGVRTLIHWLQKIR